MTSSAEQMRAWRGPAILTYGFRPFFLRRRRLGCAGHGPLGADAVGPSDAAHRLRPGVLACARIPVRLPVAAVIAGFLLTAVPNWTGTVADCRLAAGGAVCAVADRAGGGDAVA
jgi:uncharacterized protein involved in response to NO